MLFVNTNEWTTSGIHSGELSKTSEGEKACYKQDWGAGLGSRIMAPTTYIFFASALPVIAFREQLSRETGYIFLLDIARGACLVRGIGVLQVDCSLHAVPVRIPPNMLWDNMDTCGGFIVPIAVLLANKPEGARPTRGRV
ncbi:hypothetical protein MLD38_014811 [Melastoma candidum]|uniref:Uncharacterized protein n=1 Tax=Melastoma candidum TaxID=119954 RepID=A0ACB9RDX3_9MYRT|nr:hypothetical protein MLD38_014811 [Melastoma candidum]